MIIKAFSGYVPLEVKHLNREQYKALGDRLAAALGSRFKVFYDYPLDHCWLHMWLERYNKLHLPPATEVPADRYATPHHMVLSNIVQHQRTAWAVMAAAADPQVDVWVWLDYGVLKQGDWTGKPVTEKIVVDFMDRIEAMKEMNNIPFPGIWEKGVPSDTGANWRFVGSTHIWPTQYLPAIDKAYRLECMKFIERTRTVPIDLPIWANTELNSGLPFVQYPANHDATQFTGFVP
jgi:hypothetical protein